MPSFETLVGLQQALAAIDVMIRSGKGRGGNLAGMAGRRAGSPTGWCSSSGDGRREAAASQRLREQA